MASAAASALGAGFVGAVQPWAERIVAVVRALGGTPEASVIHQGWRTNVSRAALANGVLIGAFECEPLTCGCRRRWRTPGSAATRGR